MSADYLAWQFRMWETQAELESRAARAFGEDRADLDYKVAAVFYHSVWVLYPVYASQLRNSGLPHPQAGDGGSSSADDRKRLMHEFREGASSLAQASRRFEKLADRHPHSALRDKALFSAGMARIKLVNDWPWSPIGSLLEYIPEGVRLFERVTAEHPDSSLADDAANAAAYWRRNFRHAFQPGSVVGRD